MKFLAFAVLASFALGAGPTTTATRPSEITAPIHAAEKEVADAMARCLDAVHGTDDYKQLLATEKSREKTLLEARRSGTQQQRLDASSSWNAARSAADAKEKAALSADVEYQAAVKKLRDAKDAVNAEIERIRKAEKEREANSPYNRAWREGRVIPGLTEAEAHTVFLQSGGIDRMPYETVTEENDGTRIVVWKMIERSDFGPGITIRMVRIVVSNGKVVEATDRKGP